MRYEERPAPAGLEGAVSRIWFLEVPRLRRFEKILPLPYVHLIVNLSDPYAIYDPAGRSTPVDQAFVSGIQSQYLIIEAPELIRHIGIELAPAGLGAITGAAGTDVAGVVRDAVPLVEGIETLVSALRAEVASGAPDAQRLLTLAAEFIDGSSAGRLPDPAVTGALDAIHGDPGLPIPAVAARAGISERGLLTRFRAATGVSPKAYAQLWRFHRLVTALAEAPGRPDWAGLAVESGYYDQPHVIRAFRRFCGWTPTEYRRHVAEFGPDAAHFVPLDEVPASAAAITPVDRPRAASR